MGSRGMATRLMQSLPQCANSFAKIALYSQRFAMHVSGGCGNFRSVGGYALELNPSPQAPLPAEATDATVLLSEGREIIPGPLTRPR